MLFLGNECVALATNHTMNINPQFSESKTKDDAEGPAPASLDYADWDASVDALMGTSAASGTKEYDDLVSLVIAGTSVSLVADAVSAAQAGGAIPSTGFTPANSSTVFPKMTGNAFISELTIDAGETGDATISANFVAAGNLS